MRTGILPDLHYPLHDEKALQWAIRTLKRAEVKKLILLGDVVTLDAVSRFSKSLRTQADFPEELEGGRRFFQRLDRVFRDVPITLLQGNHEHRLYSYLVKNAPVLAALPELQFRKLLGIPRRWKVYTYGQYVMEQGVLVQHGRKWGHSAYRQRFLYGVSSVSGHSHRLKMMSHRLANGKEIQAVELGCLCQMDQGYATLVDWTHACGWIDRGHIVVKTRGATAE